MECDFKEHRSVVTLSRLPPKREGRSLFLDTKMTSKVKPEIRRIGRQQFPRWIIIDGGCAGPTHFWNGEGWVEGLRSAMLFAQKDVVRMELKKAKGE
jgi:hypothetical protein